MMVGGKGGRGEIKEEMRSRERQRDLNKALYACKKSE